MGSTDLRAAAQQALEALEDMLGWQSLAPQTIQESAKGRAAALKAALAEPVQEPDSPERRCGGPGCDMRCCQPVQEPQGCAHCNHPLYAAVKCRVCGRVTEPVQEPVAYSVGRTLHWHQGKGVSDAQLFAAPPQRKPLTDEQIDAVWDEWFGAYGLRGSAGSYTRSGFARAIERAHGIGGEG